MVPQSIVQWTVYENKHPRERMGKFVGDAQGREEQDVRTPLTLEITPFPFCLSLLVTAELLDLSLFPPLRLTKILSLFS